MSAADVALRVIRWLDEGAPVDALPALRCALEAVLADEADPEPELLVDCG